MTNADIGIVGLGVMGQMLALNIERNGYHVAVFDLNTEKVATFEQNYPKKKLTACRTLETFVAALAAPHRRILMMVPAGNPVDSVITSLKPFLETNDLLVDGGNTHFKDTERRANALASIGILYIGTGVSGGEYGALWGPSIMPGGQLKAWESIRVVFEAIAAKVNGDPCVSYIGPGGAGHYVKMVHNGIEYGDMQLIAEAYDILHRGLGLSNAELHEIFTEWNRGELESYLIEITADIFTKNDPETGEAIIDLILDEAKQKGTGKWTSQESLDLGAPAPTINAAVQSRIVSAYKSERVTASHVLSGPEVAIADDPKTVIGWVRDALYGAKICSYAQGFALMQLASEEYEYNLNYGEISRIWRGGCIIRAKFLNEIRDAFIRNPDLPNLMLDPDFTRLMNSKQAALRRVVALAANNGIPTLAFSASLGYYDAYRTARLPANLTQSQRDYFGAHTYRRTDKKGSFHYQWIEDDSKKA
ncbi:MAG: NADP-dependent phosphogluconate dehydrogenase [Pseudomonadota bacterium]